MTEYRGRLVLKAAAAVQKAVRMGTLSRQRISTRRTVFVEAIDHPIRYHLTDGREVCLEPGQPLALPEDRALKLLARAKGKVRLAELANPEWLAEWRTLARITDGIRADDPRFQPVMAALEQCDTTFLAGDWPAFQRAAAQVWRAVQTEV